MYVTNTVSLLTEYQKIGTEIPAGMSAMQALEHAGLAGWNQHLVEPIIMDGATEYPTGKHRFNVGTTPLGLTVFGPVLESYLAVQHEEAFGSVVNSLGGLGLAPSVMGAYDNGKAAFACFALPDVNLSGEAVGGYLVATKRNDGGGSMKATISKQRIWCANQLHGLAKSTRPMLSIRHTRNADPLLMAQAQVLLKLADEWDVALAQEIAAMKRIEVSKQTYIKKIIPAVLNAERPDEQGRSQTIYDRKFDELVAAWSSPVHAEGDNGFRAYSQVAEWELHHRTGDQQRLAEAALADRLPGTDRALRAVLALA